MIKIFKPDFHYNCYNPKTNDCDMRCQGASECELARYYNGLRENKPTREELLNNMKKSYAENCEMSAWTKYTIEGKQWLNRCLEDLDEHIEGFNDEI